MILVDTSVFIDFFKGRETIKTKQLEHIIQLQVPFGITELIYQELLQGAKNEKEFEILKSYLGSLHFYHMKNKESYENSAKVYIACRKKGITIRNTVDLIIAQTAIDNDLFLLHNDKDFAEIGRVSKKLKFYK